MEPPPLSFGAGAPRPRRSRAPGVPRGGPGGCPNARGRAPDIRERERVQPARSRPPRCPAPRLTSAHFGSTSAHLRRDYATPISPSQGSSAGGQTVTITGTNLAGATAVRFGGNAGTTVTLFGSGLTTTSTVLFDTTPTSFTVVSDTWVTAIAPSGAAGPVNVRVTTPGGTSNSLVYTRVGAPGI
ncbi:IPT/TIG domain-containing protein [Streptomyces melanosporofaciens]|uniref:IPT/TIG domain-containing protein n=1 Tax=Streptomyces melanosporofaciens TaxID=67327 RepID=UPI000B84EDFB|nr:IPT/TIG domain-containing protein [Streptomyces melanosporofaciens]